MTIIDSGLLRDRVRDFMNKSDMTTKNIEEVWATLNSSSKSHIFQHFDIGKYLEVSLLKSSSPAYLIKWPQCFLARSQLTDDLEKRRTKRLLDRYIHCLKINPQYSKDVLKEIDQILDAFQDSIDHESLRLEFIDRIVGLCFEQGTFFEHQLNFLLCFSFRFGIFADRCKSLRRSQRTVS